MNVNASIVIADDHQLLRESLRSWLEQQPGLTVVGEAADGQAALDLVVEHHPDVLLLDLMMPGVSGLQVLADVRRRCPRTRVIVLSMFSDDQYVVEALRRGAQGYVLKSKSVAEVVGAIEGVMLGGHYLSSEIGEKALHILVDLLGVQQSEPGSPLSAREAEVLHLAAQGLTHAEIGRRLVISPRTAEAHCHSVMHKLGLHNQIDLVRYALRTGLLPLDAPVDAA